MKTLKKLSQYILSLILICTFCISSSMIGFAQSINNDIPTPKATLTISGDGFEQPQEIQLTNEEVKTVSSRNANNIYTTIASVTIDNETLNQLLKSPSSSYQGGDIALIAGMNYEVSGNSVSMRSVFGSYIPSGYFYATDRRVDWCNSVGFGRGQAFPGSNDWQYTTNSTYVDWNPNLPPYVLSECRINAYGMGGTGYNKVQFNLYL